jgi:predicted ATPase
MEILIALVDHAGQIVTKRDLVALVWPGLTVGEACLRFHIAVLRKALCDDVDGSRYIITLTGQGYCFVAPIDRSNLSKALPSKGSIRGCRGTLPQRLVRMIGRDETVNEISSQLAASRFITIVGPGGMGKTTVALAVGHTLLEDFVGSVHFIDFGPIADPSLAPSMLASTLGLIIHASDPSPSVVNVLRTKRSLLVLDGCEPVIDAVAELAEHISREVPNIHILATSREPLCAAGEHVYWLPALEGPPDNIEITAAVALTYPAASLFVERVIASGHRFELADVDAPALASVCRKLDGVALAIELAAGSVNAYGIDEILRMLDAGLTLLWRGCRTALPRHQTLCATLDWSYDLLPEHERSVARRLSVFAGTFTLEGAKAVAGEDDALAIPAIANLVRKSLVTVLGDNRQRRYRLLDTTRAYLREKLLATDESEKIARRHANYYRNALKVLARSPATNLAECSEELANVRAALDWAFGIGGDVGLGIALAASATQLFLELSLLTECHRWTERAMAELGDLRGTQVELVLQSALGLSLMFIKGNSKEARDALTRGLTLAERLSDVPNQLRQLVRLHFFIERTGDFSGALAFAQRGQLIAQELEDPSGVAAAHSMLGSSHHILGNHAAARPHLEAAAALTQHSRRTTTIDFGFDPCSRAAVVLARNLWVLGYSDQATSLAVGTVIRAEESGHPIPICIALIWAVSTYFGTGDWASAEENINKFVAHADRCSLESYYAVGRGATGKLLIKRGNAEAGVGVLENAIETLHSRSYELHTAAFNSALAEGWAMLGHFDRALTIVDETILSIDARGNTFRLPELLRLKGAILSSSRGDMRAGEEWLLQSFRLAEKQSALAWQLRTASSLARLWFATGRIEDARSVLISVYRRFTEGFACPDLRAAQQLLDEIEAKDLPQRQVRHRGAKLNAF